MKPLNERYREYVAVQAQHGKVSAEIANLAGSSKTKEKDISRAKAILQELTKNSESQGSASVLYTELENAQNALSSHITTDTYKNSADLLEKAEVGLRDVKNMKTPSGINARGLLKPINLTRSNYGDGPRIFRKKLFAAAGVALALYERTGTPVGLSLIAFTGLDMAVNKSSFRWGTGGAGLAIAGLAIGTNLVPESYKLSPWQKIVQDVSSNVPKEASFYIKQATRSMIDSYASGFNAVASTALALALSKGQPAASAVTVLTLAISFGFAFATARNHENHAQAMQIASGGLALAGAAIGIAILLSEHPNPVREEKEPELSKGAYLGSVAFPSAIGLLSAALFVQNFLNSRHELHEARSAINKEILKSEVAKAQQILDDAKNLPGFLEERALSLSVVQKNALYQRVKAEWEVEEPQIKRAIEEVKTRHNGLESELSQLASTTTSKKEVQSALQKLLDNSEFSSFKPEFVKGRNR